MMRAVVCAAAFAGVLSPSPADPFVSRQDLARAYLEFEAAYRRHPPPEEQASAVHQAFDQVTLLFFRGAFDQMLRGLTEQTARLEGQAPLSGAAWFARSLSARAEPAVWWADEDAPRTVLLRQMFAQPWPADPGGARVEAWSADGECRWSQPCDLSDAAALPAELHLPDSLRLPVGPLTFHWISDGEVREIGRVSVVPGSLDAVRDGLLARLEVLGDAGGSREEARRICRSRAGLLTDHPSESRSAEFLWDPNVLCQELGQEVAALEAGHDPYRDRRGDWWRVLPSRSGGHPLRQYVPAGDAPADGWPVVIAFHGAGGDENMFMDGYGAGRLKELADRRRFLAITPFTSGAAGQRGFLDRLLDSLADDHPIDRSRVYVLGHSMGTGPTAMLAGSAADRVAAACCIAGTAPSSAGCAPTLWLRGTRDPLSQGPAPQPGDRPLTVRELPGRGHTLIVSDELESVIDWLLGHDLAAGAAERGGDRRP